MRVFLTWSGPTSKGVATTFREWLPKVIQSIIPYMSEEDIGKGHKWFADVSSQLTQSDFGIVCLTPDNLNEPWIHFEAGALGGKLDQARVTPFLIGLSPTDIAGPLTQFQATKFDKEDVKLLIKSMNKEGEVGGRLSTEVLESTFSKFWPDLEAKLNEIVDSMSVVGAEEGPERPDREILEEILELTRSQARAATSFGPYIPSTQILWPPSATPGIISARTTAFSPTFATPFAESAGPSTLEPKVAELIERASEYLGDEAERVSITEGYLVVRMRDGRAPTDEEISSLTEIAEPYGFQVGYLKD